MATLTVQDIAAAGTSLGVVTPTASTGDDFVASDDQRHGILVVNGSGSPINVTVSAQTTQAQQVGAGVQAVADIVKAVAAGAVAIIPVLPAFIRNNDAKVEVLCSSVTDVDIAVFKLPRLAY